MKKPIVLVIMDGVGRGDGGSGSETEDFRIAFSPINFQKAPRAKRVSRARRARNKALRQLVRAQSRKPVFGQAERQFGPMYNHSFPYPVFFQPLCDLPKIFVFGRRLRQQPRLRLVDDQIVRIWQTGQYRLTPAPASAHQIDRGFYTAALCFL